MQWIKNIEDPSNVAAIQKFFGVTYNRRLPLESIPQNEYSQDEIIRMVPRTTSPTTDTQINGDNSTNVTTTQCHTNNVETGALPDSGQVESNYTIRCKCWYYFFISLTTLGDVIGYALVFPFIFWNVDGVIARKLVIIWTIIMYVGQAVKEIVCRGRPECPPVIRLQKRWSEEYGMPSTHAMASIALPASLFYYLYQRYEFPLGIGIVISFVWCILISFSRLYLGMHSILDVTVGFFLSILLLIFLLPGTDLIDESLVQFFWSPLILLVLSIFLIAVYPKPSGPRTAHSRTDTTIILATCVGIETGCWLNYKLQIAQKVTSDLSYSLPDVKTIGSIALRTVLGLFCIGISFIIFELVSKFIYWILKKINLSRYTDDSGKIPLVDLFLKYLTFCITSMHVTFSIPLLFKALDLHRHSYLTE